MSDNDVWAVETRMSSAAGKRLH